MKRLKSPERLRSDLLKAAQMIIDRAMEEPSKYCAICEAIANGENVLEQIADHLATKVHPSEGRH